MDATFSTFLQDELASTIEHAVKAAVDTGLCEITKVVGSKFDKLQMEMVGKERENESLKLRLEISERALKSVRECVNAADGDIRQLQIFQDPKESCSFPESEAQERSKIKEEVSFDQELSELGFRASKGERDSTPSLQGKNSSSGKEKCKKLR
ncbi:UNVERIFIED_CONTAM: hypothetical protein FKN15_014876 [Acipenser sinensis]